MDNQDKIQFKEFIPRKWWYKIDRKTGERQSFPKKHGFYNEMQVWVAAGNEIEPLYTEQELIEKEQEEAKQAQLSINSEAREFLKNNDWKIKRHNDQKIMIEKGIGGITQTSLTESEFEALLIECQQKRELVIEV